ncbi:glycosyltransferase family 2 protein [Mucilaginibacter dorajii]|uniref:Glycosyltransferase 2-like domain-containing protein n=1 Tax=Mucilaginibacter dorajii TaxID=692994 RepID=A0ABP7PII4_9SPHI|nr:glycosyltransferase family 2 protein [Mucilaginibacter dorajii]MCS3733427.1 glycosyltransferase involved in cell wall biosynthesis [Mucilaginibacter dorajii]
MEFGLNSSTDILLSICIPTYNRDKLLYSCILSIYKQLQEISASNVEIVVSNNCSTDLTSQIVAEFTTRPNFKYFEQPVNVGLAGNVLKVVEYASGQYCWIIGDDDFLLPGAVASVLELLSNKSDINYFYAKVTKLHVDEFEKYAYPFDTSMYQDNKPVGELKFREIDKFEKLITPEYSLIFLGEIMASIFKRDVWMQYKGNFEGDFLDTLETTYPHSVVFANTLFGQKAIYIDTPLILVLDGAREWWDRVGYVIIVHIRSLLDLYKKNGLSGSDLRKCNTKYIEISSPYFIKYLKSSESKYKDKISKSRYLKFVITHPISLFSFWGQYLTTKMKNVFRKFSK